MKKKLFAVLILILCVLLFVFDSKDIDGATVNHKALVNEYYFDGTYTKKSNIYLNSASEHEIAKYFHGEVAMDRTTYYKDDILLMGDFDGGFDEINSGYRTNGNNMSHFTYKDGYIKDDYVVENTSLHEFYVTLDKMVDSAYFDSSWINGVHNVTSDDDLYLSDFLAFTAPCLTELVFSNFYITKIGMKLTVSEGNHPIYGNYLALRIHLCPTDEGKASGLILSEARIYKGNLSFDESITDNPLIPLKEAFDNIGGNCKIESTVFFNELAIKRVNYIYDTNFYCNQTTLFDKSNLYRYSDDFYVNDAYYLYNNSLYKTSLIGNTISDKLNSIINHTDSELVSDDIFNVTSLNSAYVDKYGPTVIKYSNTYSKEFLGWARMGESQYYCDRTEVISDLLKIVAPGFTNEGTYMTFRYVTVEINSTNGSLVIRLYASPTQIGKLINDHKDLLNVNKYLLFAEARIYDIGNINIPALNNIN